MKSFLDHVPDIPRWVEARSLLLSGRCRTFGSGPGFVIVANFMPLLCIVGRPEPATILEAAGNQAEKSVALAAPENEGYVARILNGWKFEPAILHLLGNDTSWLSFSTDQVRLLQAQEIPEETPKELRDELIQALDWGPVTAVFINGKAVSFCYAGSITESLWDVSIDTLESYRGKGLAGGCVAFMIQRMRKLGREPVWGSMQSNVASLRLADKMGFVPVDRLAVFSRNPKF